MNYLDLLSLVAPVYLIIATGFTVRRLGWLTASADASLLRLVVNLLIPCLIFDSILGNASLARIENLVLPPLLGFATVVIGFLIARLAGPLLGADARVRRTFAFTTGIYNYSYIPLLLVLALFDRATLGVLFTFNLGVEVAFWTVGLMVLTGSGERVGWRRLLNPPILSILFSVGLNAILRPELIPHFIMSALHTVGGVAIPLALLLTGATVADWIGTLKTGFRSSVLALSCALRLGALPVMFLLAARWLPISMELKRILVIQAAMPAGMLPVVISRHYGGDAGVALQVVLGTSVVGLLTTPFWIRFGLHFVGS